MVVCKKKRLTTNLVCVFRPFMLNGRVLGPQYHHGVPNDSHPAIKSITSQHTIVNIITWYKPGLQYDIGASIVSQVSG